MGKSYQGGRRDGEALRAEAVGDHVLLRTIDAPAAAPVNAPAASRRGDRRRPAPANDKRALSKIERAT
jgi:hypothetical protein